MQYFNDFNFFWPPNAPEESLDAEQIKGQYYYNLIIEILLFQDYCVRFNYNDTRPHSHASVLRTSPN